MASTKLANKAVGSIIKLKESGSLVEFYVAKHDYENGLNGSGRTLVVRKDCYDTRVFSNSNNAFSGSAIDTWLNGTYLKLLDSDIQTAIGTTKFYYTPGNNSNSVTTLSRAVFLLSVTELGKTTSGANTEGSALSIASTLQIAYCNGSACAQWTRTPSTNGTGIVFCLSTVGNINASFCIFYYGSRPAFTLPGGSLYVLDDGTVSTSPPYCGYTSVAGTVRGVQANVSAGGGNKDQCVRVLRTERNCEAGLTHSFTHGNGGGVR